MKESLARDKIAAFVVGCERHAAGHVKCEYSAAEMADSVEEDRKHVFFLT